MKRNRTFSLALCLLLLAMLLLPAAAAFNDDTQLFTTTETGADYTYQAPLLVDDAGLLTDREAKKLLDVLEKSSERAGVDIIIVTKSDIGAEDVRVYAQHYYSDNDYGRGANNDGVMLLLSVAVRNYCIITAGLCDDMITPYGIDTMTFDIISDLSKNKYLNAFETFAKECEDMISQERDGNVYDLYTNADDLFRYGGYHDDAVKQFKRQNQGFNYVGAALIAVGIGFVLALVTAFVMKGKLKTVRHKYEASNYVVPGSLRLQNQEDRFLYASVSKTQIASDNNQHTSGGHGGLSGGISVGHGSSGGPHVRSSGKF